MRGVHVKGDVYAGSYLSYATGIQAFAGGNYDATVYVGGNVIALSTGPGAFGVVALSSADTSVSVGGDVVVSRQRPRPWCLAHFRNLRRFKHQRD